MEENVVTLEPQESKFKKFVKKTVEVGKKAIDVATPILTGISTVLWTVCLVSAAKDSKSSFSKINNEPMEVRPATKVESGVD